MAEKEELNDALVRVKDEMGKWIPFDGPLKTINFFQKKKSVFRRTLDTIAFKLGYVPKEPELIPKENYIVKCSFETIHDRKFLKAWRKLFRGVRPIKPL